MQASEVVPAGSRAITPYDIPEIVKELTAAGILPRECKRFELIMEPAQLVQLRFEVNATQEQVKAIADALIRHPEQARSIVKLIAYPRPESDSATPAAVKVQL